MNNHFVFALVYTACSLLAIMWIFTVRGFAEALAARLLGDKTAQEDRFLSLNPTAHMDPVGLIILALCMLTIELFIPAEFATTVFFAAIIFLSIQWVYVVPVNTNYFRYPRLGALLVFVAGLFSLLLAAFIAMLCMLSLPIASLGVFNRLSMLAFELSAHFATWVAVISCVPLPPFRLFWVVVDWAPLSWYSFLDWLQEHRFFITLMLFLVPGTSTLFIMAVDYLQGIIFSQLSGLALGLVGLLG